MLSKSNRLERIVSKRSFFNKNYLINVGSKAVMSYIDLNEFFPM
jgi:hypothetical protein